MKGPPRGWLSSLHSCRLDPAAKPAAERRETLRANRACGRRSTAERKRRTRRLILIGSYMEHVTQTDPDRKARLMKGLDGFLERDRDRELFDLDPK